MRFAIFKGEKSIGELIGRIFRKSSGTATAGPAEKQAADALLRANPQLADMTKVPIGTKIVVPDAPLPVNPTEVKIQNPVFSPVRVTQDISQRLESLKTSLPAAASSTVTNANAMLALTQKAEVQAAAAKDPVLAQRLASITKQANARIQNAQNVQAEFQKAIGPMQAFLAKLLKA